MTLIKKHRNHRKITFHGMPKSYSETSDLAQTTQVEVALERPLWLLKQILP